MKKSQGFSLLEIIIALGLMGVIGLITTGLISRSFRGNNKVELIGKIRQNGQNVLASFESTARSSDYIVCNTPTVIGFQDKSGSYVRIKYLPPTQTSNGVLYKQVFNSISDPSKTNELCLDSSLIFPESPSQTYLTDNNPVSGVSISKLIFTRHTGANNQDSVEINMDISPAINSASGYDNQLGGSGVISFKTTVEIK